MVKERRKFRGKIGATYRDSEPWWPEPTAAPPDAPNIVFIVLDDVGFSDLGCYGSEIATPRMDALAAGGLRYSNFHVTAMCSPTRACLLTGRNAHAVGMGIIAEWSSGFPGYRGRVTRQTATVPEILRDHAYGTYAVGKWHLTGVAEYGSAGPTDDWPLGRGFSRWYGFHGALADQWNPELYQDNRPIHLTPGPGYHLSSDLVDHAIADVRDHVTTAPNRPFFLYLAFGACHWPHHVPRSYIERQRGRYDVGWDEIRAQRLQSQLDLKIVPADTRLAPRNPGVEPWASLPAGVRKLAARLQETYAAFLEHTDAEIGRLIDFLAALGRLENTLIVLLSDNGASSEGGATGAINLRKHMVYEEEPPDVGLAHLDEIGGDLSFNHYPTGWAQVSNTPLKWYKKDTHGGGIRAPLIIHWPKRIAARGEIRTQFHHVTDLAPTLYELLKTEVPKEHHGVSQMPMHGISMAYTFDRPEEPTRKQMQHFELLGDRAIWHAGWKAVSRHVKGSDFDADRWELYRLDKDFSEIDDLASNEPERLRELVALWQLEAEKYDVLPLDDRDWERAAARLRMNPKTRYEYLGQMARVDRLLAPDITDRSYIVTAEFVPSHQETTGIILAWGSRFAGFTIYLKDSRVWYEYVYSESVRHVTSAEFCCPASGSAKIRLQFERTGKNSGRAHLAVGDAAPVTVEIPKTWPTHGTTAGLNCGQDAGAPVSDAYRRPFRFTGDTLRVTVELDSAGGTAPGAAYSAALREQ
jgi:arylsulfatase A-like enzyme